MTVRLGANVQSLQAQRRLGQATDRTTDVYRRLSTGQRISKAADDAAGLAIVESLTSKSRVFARGAQNISDGVSALTIADAAVEALTQITTRIQELAEQGANGSYSPAQRTALDKEAQSLRDEFLRIVRATSFNGRNLLDGSVQGLEIQAGYGTDGALASSVGGKLGTGNFDTAVSSTIPGAANLLSVATSDLNGDGTQDAVVVETNALQSNVLVNLGSGDGTFQLGAVISGVGNQFGPLLLSDMNRDSIQDIVLHNVSSSLVAVYLGNSNGTFGSAQSVAVDSGSSSLAVADFDGDGIQDVAAANSGADNVRILLGNGDGTLRTGQTYAVGDLPGGLTAADFNGDGAVDLATANYLGNSLSVLYGNGNGSFQSSITPTAGINPVSITAADFNGDGFIDIAAANAGGNNVSIHLANRTGFTKATNSTFSSAYFPSEVKAADFNGDGFHDLFTVGLYDDGLFSSSAYSVALGRGNGTFGTPTEILEGFLYGSSIGDFNNDGVSEPILSSNGHLIVLPSQTRDGVHPLLPISLKTQADSKQALSIVSKKLELLSAQRGVIGAAQSRLLSSWRAISSQRDEFVAATARIRDTDFAGETAELSRNRIIQSAATAVMAQANQQPAIALQLLRI